MSEKKVEQKTPSTHAMFLKIQEIIKKHNKFRENVNDDGNYYNQMIESIVSDFETSNNNFKLLENNLFLLQDRIDRQDKMILDLMIVLLKISR